MTLFEVEVRDYLRTDATLLALVNNDLARINMEWTGNINASHVTLYRAGGNTVGYYPFDLPAIAIHCYGSTRPAAAALASAVGDAMRAITSANAPLLDATVESTVYLPTVDGTARYVVTTSVTARLGLPA